MCLILAPAIQGCRGADAASRSADNVADGGDAFPSHATKVPSAAGDSLFVAEATKDALEVWGVDEKRWLDEVPIGRDPVEIDGPVLVIGDVSGERLYVALNYPDELNPPEGSHVHATSRAAFVQQLSRADLRILSEVRIDADPVSMALSRDGTRLVVTHAAKGTSAAASMVPSTVSVVDTRTMAIEGSPEPVRISSCLSAQGVTLSEPDGRTAYVACADEDAVAIVDTTDPSAEVRRIALSDAPAVPGKPVVGPRSVSLSPSGAEVVVTNVLSGDLRFVDTATASLKSTVWPVAGAFESTWSADGSTIVVMTRADDGLTVLDVVTGNTVAAHPFTGSECPAPRHAAVGTAAVYVLCDGGASDGGATSRVVALDPSIADAPITSSLDVGDRAQGFWVAP